MYFYCNGILLDEEFESDCLLHADKIKITDKINRIYLNNFCIFYLLENIIIENDNHYQLNIYVL